VTRASRGGEVTYHGPGQLVCYPIVRLRRGVLAHVEGMARAVIELLADLEIAGEWRRTLPGVWVGSSKICAFWVQVRHGISVHGLALNVTTDLGAFATIVPCGLPGVGVTSVAQLRRGSTPSMPTLASQLARFLARALGLDLDSLPIPIDPPESFSGFQLQIGKPDR
jgi:lipoyl(octanoyl) transferase